MRNQPSDGSSTYSGTSERKVYLRKEPLARYGSSAERKHRELFILGPVLIGLSVLLAVGWYLSHKKDGFNTPIVSQSVLTYTPTAVMLLIISLWRQVDYRCKTAAPWDELRKSPATATRSVLLDYVSTFQAISLFQSIRNGHVAVVLGILGFVLLKAATVASTGLLVLAPKVWTDSRTIVVQNRFDGSLYNASDFTSLFDQSPVYTTYGVLANGLEYPFGTTSDHAYATFSWPDDSESASTFEVTVGGVFPTLQCKHADVSIEFAPSNTTDQNPDHNIKLSSSLCDTSPGQVYALNPAEFLCPSRQLSGTVYSIECGDEQSGAVNETWELLTLTDMRYAQTLNTSQAPDQAGRIQAFSSSTTVAGMTSILCKLSYSVGDLAVSGVFNDTSQLSGRGLVSNKRIQLDGLTNSDLTSLAESALLASSNMFGRPTDNTYAEEYPNVLFKLMASQYNGTYAALFDEGALMEAAQTVFQHVAVQMVHKYLRRNETTFQDASVEYVHRTVHISELSVWVMIAAFLATVCASAALMFYGSRSKCDSLPSSILAYAALTSKSGTVRPLLLEGNGESGAMLRKRLKSYMFHAVFEGPSNLLSISAVPPKGEPATVEGTCSEEAHRWYTQLSTSRWYIISTFCYAITIIAVLEVLQRLSDTGSGIVDVVSNSELWRTAISHYIPALVAILLATMFNCLDFNVLLLDPFNRLKAQKGTSAICHRLPIGQYPLSSFHHAVLQRRVGAVGSSSAAFVGGLLSIIVSGLYTVQDYPAPRSVAINAIDVFQASWPNSVLDDGGAAISTSLIENLNLSFPRGTWDEVAVPLFEWEKSLQNLGLSSSSLDIAVPMTGLRAKLICEAAYAGEFDISISGNRIQQSAFANSTYHLPRACQMGGPGGNLSTLEFQETFHFPLNQTEAYIARLLDLHVGPYDNIFGASGGESSPENNPDNPAGCPSIALIYGYLSQEDLLSSAPAPLALSIQVCYQTVERLAVNTTFEIIDSVPRIKDSPQLDDSGAQQLFVPRSDNNGSATPTNETAFQFRVQKHFDTALAFFDNSRNPFALSEGNEVPVVDRFFQGVLFGRNNLSIDALKVLTATDQSRMFDNIHSFYRRYMAQAISSKMRVNITTLSHNELDQSAGFLTFNGQIVRGINKSRLVQHETSKWILQGMISFMILGGILAVTTTTFNKLLPASGDPCTIWGQMSLWAGSQYCDVLANSTDQVTELSIVDTEDKQPTVIVTEEIVSTRDQLMLHFRLGWWPNKGVTIGHPRARYGIEKMQA